MNFKERFKLYILGVLGGILLVTLFFGNRSSCRDGIVNYLPEGRVRQDILFHDIEFSGAVQGTLAQLNIDKELFKKYIEKADVDFDLSEPRAEPCGKYVLFSQDSVQKLEIRLDKCKDKVLVTEVVSNALNN